MDDFYKIFKQEETDLLEIISGISNVQITTEEKQAAVEKSLEGISQLSEKVRDASGTLPNRDLQTYTKAINLLKEKLEQVRVTSAPPKKFTFKKTIRQTPTAVPSTTNTNSTSSSNEKEAIENLRRQERLQSLPLTTQPLPGFRLSSLNDTDYVLDASTLGDASIASLETIQGSIVNISLPLTTATSFATLMIKSVEASLLICGTITGSAHITGLHDSTLIITARQIRVHSCQNVVIYLHCSSRPIIEDCKEIRFAPLPWAFTKDDATRQPNLWNQVDDFKWLRPEPSPNWRVLKSDDSRAIDEESWKKIMNEQSTALGLEERLQLAKVK